jgi:hypothetical protein
MMQRTINPKEACLFYVGVLFYQADGTTRAGLVLKEQAFFYRISVVGKASFHALHRSRSPQPIVNRSPNSNIRNKFSQYNINWQLIKMPQA